MSERRRILFVDDEPEILSGIRNVLYKDRKRWDLAFAGSAAEALAAMRASPFDVVVSDMRMPRMDGAALLSIVKEEFPGTARIMLSGHAERDAIVRALPAVHQMLSKPCDEPTLRGALERGLGLAAIRDPRIRAVIGCVDKLPSLPDVFGDLEGALRTPSTTGAELVAIAGRDLALTAKLLQLVNSPYFGARRSTASIEQAVSLLGTERIRHIGATASVFSPIDLGPSFDVIADIHGASASAAQVARTIAKEPDEAFVAALLHDIGHVVLILGLGKDYLPILERFHETQQPLYEIETEMLGVTHAEVGACLLGLWGLPTSIVEMVRHHHDPGSAPEAYRGGAAVVHVADCSVHAGHEPNQESLARAGVLSELPRWREITRVTPAKAAS